MVVSLAIAAGFASSPPPASAFTASPASVIDDVANWAAEYNLATGQTAFTPVAGEEAAVGAAEVASGFTPALPVLGGLALGVGALTGGYLIGTALNNWLGISCLAGGCLGSAAGFSGNFTYTVSNPAWIWDSANSLWKMQIENSVSHTPYWSTSGTGWDINRSAEYNAWNSASVGTMSCTLTGSYTGSCASAVANPSVCGGGCIYTMHRYATNAQLTGGLAFTPVQPYGSQAYTTTYGTNLTVPSDPGSGSGVATSVRTTLKSGNDETDARIARILDPTYEGEAFEWPAASVLETYTNYLGRLRTAGWLGVATVTNLSGLEGDPAYGVSGVPCTSRAVGSTIGTLGPATFFVNPSSSFSNDHGSDGGSCGGGAATTEEEPECEFNDAIGLANGTWDETANEWGSYTLDAECAEAWSILQDLGIINENGSLTEQAIEIAENMDLTIENPALKTELPLHGSAIEFWKKVFIDTVGSTPLETTAGNAFELHFYRDIADNPYTGKDFKIVFRDWFS